MKIQECVGFSREEMIETICKVAGKARMYPPAKNRTAWFVTVFREKLLEARAEILAYRKKCWGSLF